MANQNPLAYTGRVLASTSRVGVCQFNPQDFSVSGEGVVSLGGTGAVQTVNSLLPTAGNILIQGTGSQIGVANAGSTVTLSLPSAVTAPGSVASTTFLSAGTQLRCNGGAVTDFIGQATLTAGTVSVANTNITADDRIFLSVSDINGSTKLGHLTFTITPATGFVINSRQASTPASLETSDISIVDYFIVRQF